MSVPGVTPDQTPDLSPASEGVSGEGAKLPPRVIVNAHPADYVLVGRVVQLVTAPGYRWSSDNYACIAYGDGTAQRTFWARRNAASITVYGPA